MIAVEAHKADDGPGDHRGAVRIFRNKNKGGRREKGG